MGITDITRRRSQSGTILTSKGITPMETQDRILLRGKIHPNWRSGCTLCGGGDGEFVIMVSRKEIKPLKAHLEMHQEGFDRALAEQHEQSEQLSTRRRECGAP